MYRPEAGLVIKAQLLGKAGAGRSQVQEDLSGLQSKFKTSLSNLVSPYYKIKWAGERSAEA